MTVPDLLGRDCEGSQMRREAQRGEPGVPETAPFRKQRNSPESETDVRPRKFRRTKFVRYRVGWVFFTGIKRLGIQVSWLKYR